MTRLYFLFSVWIDSSQKESSDHTRTKSGRKKQNSDGPANVPLTVYSDPRQSATEPTRVSRCYLTNFEYIFCRIIGHMFQKMTM